VLRAAGFAAVRGLQNAKNPARRKSALGTALKLGALAAGAWVVIGLACLTGPVGAAIVLSVAAVLDIVLVGVGLREVMELGRAKLRGYAPRLLEASWAQEASG